MEFSKQKYWSRLTFPTPGDLPGPGVKPELLHVSCIVGRLFTVEPPGKTLHGLLLLLLLSRFSRVRLCATPWTAAHQAPLSMGFSRQEYWSGVPLPSLPWVELKVN